MIGFRLGIVEEDRDHVKVLLLQGKIKAWKAHLELRL